MEQKFCQSCGMPMGDTDEHYGTNADGTKSTDYCKYCYDSGTFTTDCTMEEMIEECIPHMEGMPEDQARSMMQQFLPALKRWKK